MAHPSHYDGRELEALSITSRYQRWIAEQFAPYLSGRIMEVGAGIGTMARHWLEYSSELHLVEPARNLYIALNEALSSSSGVSLYCGTLDDVVCGPMKHSGHTLDAAIMVNVLEHIADDIGTLRLIHDLLKPNGYLLLFVPALPALFGSLDRAFGHQRRYTKSSLKEAVTSAGFDLVRLRYFDVLGVLPWWLVGRVMRSQTIRPAMAGLYDRYAVPVGRLLEAAIPPPFGKNLVVVARR